MLQIKNLKFHYLAGKNILENIQFSLKKGEILAILGESGSGKSTLLRIIYGLEDAISGEIFFNEKLVFGPKYNLVPGHADMKFVPQEFDLLDSITVGENVGKYLSNFNLPLKKDNIDLALDVVDLSDYQFLKPNQLSGGQRQRVAIARAIAVEPELLLLDEPYSHLDHPLKYEIRKKLVNWSKSVQSTLIFTTHDWNDALGYADYILVLKDGIQIQLDSPENLRENPLNEYVAGLLGEFTSFSESEFSFLFGIEIPLNKNAIVYPEEIIEDEDGIEFDVVETRFRGRNYLIEAKKNGKIIRFYANSKPKSPKVWVKILKFREVDL